MSLEGLVGAALFSMSPILEVRGGIPWAIALGSSPLTAYTVSVVFNILTIPLIFFFLDFIHIKFMKINFYAKLFNLYLGRVRRKAEVKIQSNWPYFGLFLFVGLPLPGTGIWTAGLISWFFGMNRKKSFITIALGSMLAGLLTLLITVGVIKLF